MPVMPSAAMIVPQHRVGDRAVHQRVGRKGRVHAQHMLHGQIIGAVIGDVVEGDEQAEGGERKAHDDLGVAGHQHGKPPSLHLPQRVSLASAPWQSGESDA